MRISSWSLVPAASFVVGARGLVSATDAKLCPRNSDQLEGLGIFASLVLQSSVLRLRRLASARKIVRVVGKRTCAFISVLSLPTSRTYNGDLSALACVVLVRTDPLPLMVARSHEGEGGVDLLRHRLQNKPRKHPNGTGDLFQSTC